MRVPIVREGYPYVLLPLAAAGVLALLGLWWGSVLALLISGAMAGFFRDPERKAPSSLPGAVLSPADGRVIEARGGEGEPARLSIFLSLLDVHVNRSPVPGEVASTDFRRGRFLPAFREGASELNSQNAITIRTAQGEVRVVQVAGVLARRIVCWARRGDLLSLGQRIGLIKFGSRVDLYLPPGARLMAAAGQRVKGGLSLVAVLEEKSHSREEDKEKG